MIFGTLGETHHVFRGHDQYLDAIRRADTMPLSMWYNFYHNNYPDYIAEQNEDNEKVKEFSASLRLTNYVIPLLSTERLPLRIFPSDEPLASACG